jgi:hypothetical protein
MTAGRMEEPQRHAFPETARADRVIVAWNHQALINDLHGKMAELRDDLRAKDAWSVPVHSSVSLAMLNNACEPNGRPLDWSVYQTLLDMAQIHSDSFVAYHAQLLHRILMSGTVREIVADPSRSVRRMRISQLKQELANVTTESDLMNYLRRLKSERKLPLREIVAMLESHHPQATSSSSCLSDWFKMDRLPRSRSRFKALISVLLPDHQDDSGREALDLIMNRYDNLRKDQLAVPETREHTEVNETSTHLQAKYLEIQRALRDTTQRLLDAEDLIARQKLTMARLRGDYALQLSRTDTAGRPTGPLPQPHQNLPKKDDDMHNIDHGIDTHDDG